MPTNAKKPKIKPPSEALREAIAKSGLTRYRIAVDAGVEYSAVHRFMARERGLAVETFDRLCAALGLALRALPQVDG